MLRWGSTVRFADDAEDSSRAVASRASRSARPRWPTAMADSTLATSAVTGTGIESLRILLAQHAYAQRQSALAPSLSRCRHHVAACLAHLRQAHQTALFEEPADILAVQVRSALEELGEMVGAVYTDDLLDRIFSRFCIGK